jgi:hypothetical protein
LSFTKAPKSEYGKSNFTSAHITPQGICCLQASLV